MPFLLVGNVAFSAFVVASFQLCFALEKLAHQPSFIFSWTKKKRL